MDAAPRATPTPAPTPARAAGGTHPVLPAVALVLIAVNLRTTVASLPPLLSAVERDLHLSGAAAGVLTSLPVLCMAWFAPAAHRLARRFGTHAATLGAMALVAVGNGLRAAQDSVLTLFAGILLAGVGVAVCGVVLPAMVRESFPRRVGAATGAYSVAMMLGSATAAAASVPMAHLLGSWRASLAAWAAPAVLAVVALLVLRALRARGVGADEAPPGASPSGRLPWRGRTAWLLAAFFSLQASLAYAYLAWLAPAQQAQGWSAEAAGALLAGNNLAQLTAALLLPALADRSADRRPALLGAVGCTVLGAGWLFALPGVWPWAAASVLGLGLGGGFSLTMVLLVDYGAHAAASSRPGPARSCRPGSRGLAPPSPALSSVDDEPPGSFAAGRYPLHRLPPPPWIRSRQAALPRPVGNSEQALAAMVFLVGYTSGAVAPTVVGALRDATGGFTVPFGLLAALALVQLAMATRLGPTHRGSQR